MTPPTDLTNPCHTMEDTAAKQRSQFQAAFAIQARKREKKPLPETPTEMFNRLSEETISKKIKLAKSAAKASIKKTEIKTITSYFGKKK